MKILNLTNLEKSDIKFKISKFPDGQQQITIEEFEPGDEFKWEQPILAYPVTIKSRLNSFMDLELIVCAKKSLDMLGFNNINLYTPYFLGARSDRQFEVGSNRYLADVMCPIINSLNFESVTVLDAHSNVLSNLLNNFKNVSNKQLVEWSILNIMKDNKQQGDSYDKNHIWISPDAGASHKIYKLADEIGYKGDVITCSKERDIDGKLTKVNIPSFNSNNKDIIIIDDICDGGATFINIVKEIKPFVESKFYLIVTHGIFSKGFSELYEYFNGIYCTNSYSYLNMPGLKTKEKDHLLLKQLDVF